jgi:hypothetical protein
MIRVPMLAVAIVSAIAVGVITAIVVMHPYLQLDATVERGIQATNLGPLTLTFPFVAWLTFVLSLRRVTDRAFATEPEHAEQSQVRHAETAPAGT